ncbi:MAG: class I SAM-dependent methyltransferase, partial [Candidatus Dormibacteraceae bacterium]
MMEKKVKLGAKLGTVARSIERRFGVMAFLNGEPRPPRGGFDLRGEKLIDWGFICSNLPPGPKRALEIGPGESPIIPAMLSLGYDVTAVDAWATPTSIIEGFRFVHSDFNKLSWDHQRFEVIVLCSVVEHIGLVGRYNSKEDPDGDLKVMQCVHDLLEPSGRVFLTIPVGCDVVHKPW